MRVLPWIQTFVHTIYQYGIICYQKEIRNYRAVIKMIQYSVSKKREHMLFFSQGLWPYVEFEWWC